MSKQTIKIGFLSLGCDKNRVDSEKMMAKLSNAGYEITPDASLAEIIIVNTCGFIESAKQESINAILEMAEYKQSGKCRYLLISGCLAERYGAELAKSIEEIDGIILLKNNDDIVKTVDACCNNNSEIVSDEVRILTTPSHYAYLKIADGCDNQCTFCAIPLIRGGYKSQPIEALIAETEKLISEYQIKELILVAQDVTGYGTDIYSEYKLPELIRRLSATDVKRIRLMYCYPERITDDLLKEIAKNDKVCKYIDIPIQHASDRILKMMNRKSTYSSIVELLKKIKSVSPDIAIRTTFLVGFPSETEEDVDKIKELLNMKLIDHAGFFGYSREEGTIACKLKPQVKKSVIKRRIKELAEIQRKNVEMKNAESVGKTFEVIYEGIDYDKQMFFGRSQYNAPDIDTLIYFSAKDKVLQIGEIYKVIIKDYENYDLIGEVK